MTFLPPSTNADYLGARVSAGFLGLIAVLTLGAGLVHSFLPDGGAQVIAGLDLGDRRDLIVGVFRWEGASQLALGLGMLAVAVRYQPLTPLFIGLAVLERSLMALQGWVIAPPASGHHPPEHYASAAMVPIGLIFIALSLRTKRL